MPKALSRNPAPITAPTHKSEDYKAAAQKALSLQKQGSKEVPLFPLNNKPKATEADPKPVATFKLDNTNVEVFAGKKASVPVYIKETADGKTSWLKINEQIGYDVWTPSKK
jgi:hypothetical protein